MSGFTLTLEMMTTNPYTVQLPRVPHMAFIGRSNVGKSSLINLISVQKAIAYVSSTPGKTQTLNFFSTSGKFLVVDLPGYGFAKVSQSQRVKWKNMISSYLTHFSEQIHLFLLIDCRHPMQTTDKEFWEMVISLPFNKSVVLTKADAASQKEASVSRKSVKTWLDDHQVTWPVFLTSAEKGTGKRELVNHILSLSTNHEERNDP